MHSPHPASNHPGAAADWHDAEELFRNHHERIVRLLQARLGVSRELAEDACGLAWLQLLRLHPHADRIVGWFYTVVNRTFVTPTLQRVRGISNGGQILPSGGR